MMMSECVYVGYQRYAFLFCSALLLSLVNDLFFYCRCICLDSIFSMKFFHLFLYIFNIKDQRKTSNSISGISKKKHFENKQNKISEPKSAMIHTHIHTHTHTNYTNKIKGFFLFFVNMIIIINKNNDEYDNLI